ncbi:hypothetical protein [Limnoglobus roseus]|uniref:Uncharacterized protein n=1 Tax=Limnoglobus roseus TaxID=2598579 RepID=A0A5C1A9R7_9BACT|nr:hypothetical protein [Limnoglobus roseus]QEL13864.1 hypothetical protein PX52LOC_00722 [Limnoglobus roseus]
MPQKKKHQTNADRQRAYRQRRKQRTRPETKSEKFRRKLLEFVQRQEHFLDVDEIGATLEQLAQAYELHHYCLRFGDGVSDYLDRWRADHPIIADTVKEITARRKAANVALANEKKAKHPKPHDPRAAGEVVERLQKALTNFG